LGASFDCGNLNKFLTDAQSIDTIDNLIEEGGDYIGIPVNTTSAGSTDNDPLIGIPVNTTSAGSTDNDPLTAAFNYASAITIGTGDVTVKSDTDNFENLDAEGISIIALIAAGNLLKHLGDPGNAAANNAAVYAANKAADAADAAYAAAAYAAASAAAAAGQLAAYDNNAAAADAAAAAASAAYHPEDYANSMVNTRENAEVAKIRAAINKVTDLAEKSKLAASIIYQCVHKLVSDLYLCEDLPGSTAAPTAAPASTDGKLETTKEEEVSDSEIEEFIKKCMKGGRGSE